MSRTEETDQVELDLAKGGDNHAEHNDADVSEDLHIGRGDSESPGREQSDDGIGGLFQIRQNISSARSTALILGGVDLP